MAGVRLLSEKSVGELPNITSKVKQWRCNKTGEEDMRNYLVSNDHIVISTRADTRLLLAMVNIIGGGHIEWNREENNGPADPRFWRLSLLSSIG